MSDDPAALQAAADHHIAQHSDSSTRPRRIDVHSRLTQRQRRNLLPRRGTDKSTWIMSSPDSAVQDARQSRCDEGDGTILDMGVELTPLEACIKAFQVFHDECEKRHRSAASSSSDAAAKRDGRDKIASSFVKKRKKYMSTKRPPKNPAKRRRRARGSIDKVQAAIRQLRNCTASGCRVHCIDEEKLSPAAVLQKNLEFMALSDTDKAQTVLDIARGLAAGQTPPRILKKPCCQKCFCAWRGFSRSTLTRNIVKAKEGHVFVPPKDRQVPSVVINKKMEAEEWTRGTYTSCGDYMPDDLSVQLPCYSMRELHSWYTHEMGSRAPYKYDQFRKLMKERFPFLHCRRHKRFSQCKVCNKIDSDVRKTSDPFKRLALMRRKDTHRAKIKEDKAKYYKHRAKGRHPNKSAMSIIGDDMDQSKTAAPRQVKLDPALDSLVFRDRPWLSAICVAIKNVSIFA